jgi:diguanylate cyclase (GGDEF)-like protein
MPDADSTTRVPIERPIDLARLSFFPIVEGAHEAIGLVEPESWRLIYINPTLRKWLAIAPARESELTINDILIADNGGSILEQIVSAWRRNDFDAMLYAQFFPAVGTAMPVALKLCRLALADRTILGLMMRSESGEPLCPDANPKHRDSLTGLPNRSFLFERLTELMAADRSHDRQFAVLFVDLDDFKQVNDVHGHLVGDRVLSAIATRLNESVRDGDCVVRYGGDEFVVLVENVTTPEEIEPLVRRLQSVMEQGISLSEGDFLLSISVGAALASPEHQTPEDLLAAADRAMYAAKRLNS